MHRSSLFPFLSSCLLLLFTSLFLNSLTGRAELTTPKHKVYVVYMGEKPRDIDKLQLIHANLLDKATGLGAGVAAKRIIYSYTKSFSGFAAMLTDEEAKKLSGVDEVVSVFPSKLRELHTTRSWNFMGFPTSASHSPFESDVIIGMIDTGIWPESKSFDDAGFGPPPAKWKGVCQSDHNFTCNNKVIGARYYNIHGQMGVGDIASPLDTLGHGSHTASTAGGRLIPNASLSGLAEGTARGAVPSARIAVYKVCWSQGCPDADLLAGFDDAIADGVDIISLSIGGSGANDYFQDSIAIGSFHAMKNGILTSSSAGNSGPRKFSVENYAPWLLTVAASTIDRKFVAQTKLGNGQIYQGMAVNTYGFDGAMYPLIYAGDAPNISSGADSSTSSFCEAGTLDSKLVKGKVVLCDALTDGSGPKQAGAVGIIMETSGANDNSFEFNLPASVLGITHSSDIHQYANTSSHPTASISKSEGLHDGLAPFVVSFSSRGPNPINPNILKPDLSAPGVDILAAWSPLSTEEHGSLYNIISGTSMACPHATGTAAYVKSFNPTWSPSAVKSALITTTYTMSPENSPDAEFAYGAGHINPVRAKNPGLVYELQETNYVKMLCGDGYSTKNLRMVTGDDSSCSSQTNGTVFDLNYPTFALAVRRNTFSATFKRTVTNVGDSKTTYMASVKAPSELKITVEPSTLSFDASSDKKSFTVKIEGEQLKETLSAALIWSDGTHGVRSPIVVYNS